jgi:DNA topoisomerase-1
VLDFATDIQTILDARETAESNGLRYVSDDSPGIRRKKAGKGFAYHLASGARLANPHILRRLKALAVPPAWTDVWLCPSADGHIQATGRDVRGRKRYHAAFREVRESVEHLFAFAEALPTIRAKVAEHIAQRGLAREKVLATVVHLLETTLIRVGNDDYAKHNKSYGLTTLKNRRVAIEGSEISFRFTGKSGTQWSLKLRDRRVAKIIRACQELPGQELLQYFDESGKLRAVTSSDVNAYLKEITGQDVTAKDLRTWAGTILAALALKEFEIFTTIAEAAQRS